MISLTKHVIGQYGEFHILFCQCCYKGGIVFDAPKYHSCSTSPYMNIVFSNFLDYLSFKDFTSCTQRV